MTKFIPFIILLVLATLLACTEDNVPEPDQGLAFVKYYGHDGDQSGTDLIETADGNYLIFGTTTAFGAEGKDLYLVKVNREGNELWSKTYDNAAKDDAVRVIEHDNSFLLLGNTQIQLGNEVFNKILLIKTDNKGDAIWQKTLRPFEQSHEWAADVITTPTAGYALLGKTTDLDEKPYDEVPMERDTTDVYTCRLDLEGNLIWEDVTGQQGVDKGVALIQAGGDFSIIFSSEIVTENLTEFKLVNYPDTVETIIKRESYLVNPSNILNHLHFSSEQGGHVFVEKTVDNDLYFAELDDDFNPVVTPFLIEENVPYIPTSLNKTKDNGYIMTSTLLGNETNSLQLTRLNSTGMKQWQVTFGNGGLNQSGTVLQHPDGGFLVTGSLFLTTNNMATLIKTNSKGELLTE